MREQLFEVLEELGIFFTDEEKQLENDIDLEEYLEDSFAKIMFALKVEKKLGVGLREDVLNEENLRSFNRFAEVVSKMSPSA